jgi:hypothetical protein
MLGFAPKIEVTAAIMLTRANKPILNNIHEKQRYNTDNGDV